MKFKEASVPIRFLLNLLRTPDVLRQTIKSGLRKRVTARLDYHLRNGYSGPFMQVDMKIANACNLRCAMCAQWGETGWHLAQPNSFVRESMPLDVYKKVVDDVVEFKPWMFIYGGEPFLYRDLLPLVKYMKEKKLTVTIVTNGTRLAGNAEELVDMGIDSLMISIDGSRETHDRIRGVAGSFNKAITGIEAIRRGRMKRGSNKPLLLISATVNKDNAQNLDEVFEVSEEARVDGLVSYYSYFQTAQSCRHYEALMQNKLDTVPVSQRGWLWSHDQIDTAALVETVKRIKARKWSFAYVFAPELRYQDIPRYYRDHSNTFGYTRCIAPWSMVEILPNGDVATCRDYPDYIVGNIKDDSILDIWNNERYQRFRNVLKDEGLLPVCSRCCGLMDW